MYLKMYFKHKCNVFENVFKNKCNVFENVFKK